MASINKQDSSADRRGTNGKGDATRGSLSAYQNSTYWVNQAKRQAKEQREKGDLWVEFIATLDQPGQ